MKTLLLLAGIILSQLSFCGDLDDGIGAGSAVQIGDDLKDEMNTKFVIRKAKAGVAQMSSGSDNEDGDVNIGGVNIIGGSTGDIVIIQNIDGDINTISE